MPRSHICPACLRELARVRALPDPHYGLPIVVCPGCAKACVRTRHPDQQFWRAFNKQAGAIGSLLARLLITLALALILIFTAGVTMNAVGRADLRTQGLMILPSPLGSDPYGLLPAGALAIVCGGLVTLMYPHLRGWRALCLLLGWAGAIVTGVMGLELASAIISRAVHPDTAAPRFPTRGEAMIFGGVFLIVAGAAAAGQLAAAVLRPRPDRHAPRRVRRVLRRCRRRRASND